MLVDLCVSVCIWLLGSGARMTRRLLCRLRKLLVVCCCALVCHLCKCYIMLDPGLILAVLLLNCLYGGVCSIYCNHHFSVCNIALYDFDYMRGGTNVLQFED